MALKSRHALLAAAFALLAWTCAASWSPVLSWLGYAFVAGIAFALFGIAAILLFSSPSAPLGSPSSLPAACFLLPSRWSSELAALDRRQSFSRPALDLQSSRLAKALDELLALILRDFICSWYAHISPNPVFPNQVEQVLRLSLARLVDLFRRHDLADVVTSRLVPILTAHVRDFSDAETSVRGRSLSRSVTESDELDLAIAYKFRHGHLHPAASLSFPDANVVQQDYLRSLVGRISPQLVPKSVLSSRLVSILVVEILACAILFPLLRLLADPDTWNQLMENYGRSVLQDRSTVRKLRAALDQHASPVPAAAKRLVMPRIAPGDGERKFEKFIRAIRKVDSLSDARRFRSEVASQLKRDSLQETPDLVYLRRLELGKRLLDQRVYDLAAAAAAAAAARAGGNGPRLTPVRPPLPASFSTPRLEQASLVELLRDSSGLSYFMEYMDRQNLLSLVQFWLVVDGFRNPLEDDGQEDDQAATVLPMWSASDRTDLQQIYESYLSKTELGLPEAALEAVSQFLGAGKSATAAQYHKARRWILRAQSSVLEEMQSRHFQAFKKSDLFYKCLASQESSSTASSLPWTRKRSDDGGVFSQKSDGSQMASGHESQGRARFGAQLAAPGSGLVTRASSSSLDLLAVAGKKKGLDASSAGRRSLDDGTSPSLSSDHDGEVGCLGMRSSVQSLAREGSQVGSAPDGRVVQAMEQALNSIMDDGGAQRGEYGRASLFGSDGEPEEGSLFRSADGASGRSSAEVPKPSLAAREAEKPSLSSLGLVSGASRIGVFVDDDLFDDEDERLAEESDEGEGRQSESDEEGVVQKTTPGDVGLTEAIAALTEDIERLEAQEAVVESLIRKAELTNNTSELRILRKSKASLGRERRRKGLQRQEYVVQESDSNLYGRTRVRIRSTEVGREEDGREFALYVIEVRREAGEQRAAASWVVMRRYSEFHELQQQLRSRYRSVRNLDFPRRRMVMKFQSEFLRRRREALEKYLKELLQLPDVCRSRELQAFLTQKGTNRRGGRTGVAKREGENEEGSVGEDDDDDDDVVEEGGERRTRRRGRGRMRREEDEVVMMLEGAEEAQQEEEELEDEAGEGDGEQQGGEQRREAARKDVMRRLYESVADGMDDLLGNFAGLEPISAAATTTTATTTTRATMTTATTSHRSAAGPGEESLAEAEAEAKAYDEGKEAEPFIKPICDIFLEVFDLKRGNDWLRGRAVVAVLQQLLGGTIERKVREASRTATGEEAMVRWVEMVAERLWPGGAAWRGEGAGGSERDEEARKRTRTEASLMLATLVPDLAGGVVGRAKAQAASRRMLATVNNGRLNVHLVYTILDEIVAVVFDEA